MTKDDVKGSASYYFPSIEKAYGQPIELWQALIREHADLTPLQLVAWLKTMEGMELAHAKALVIHTLAEDGKK